MTARLFLLSLSSLVHGTRILESGLTQLAVGMGPLPCSLTFGYGRGKGDCEAKDFTINVKCSEDVKDVKLLQPRPGYELQPGEDESNKELPIGFGDLKQDKLTQLRRLELNVDYYTAGASYVGTTFKLRGKTQNEVEGEVEAELKTCEEAEKQHLANSVNFPCTLDLGKPLNLKSGGKGFQITYDCSAVLKDPVLTFLPTYKKNIFQDLGAKKGTFPVIKQGPTSVRLDGTFGEGQGVEGFREYQFPDVENLAEKEQTQDTATPAEKETPTQDKPKQETEKTSSTNNEEKVCVLGHKVVDTQEDDAVCTDCGVQILMTCSESFKSIALLYGESLEDLYGNLGFSDFEKGEENTYTLDKDSVKGKVFVLEYEVNGEKERSKPMQL